MLEPTPPGVVLIVYLVVQGVFITGVETARRCYVCGPGDYQEECEHPETSLLPATCMTISRYCSITIKRRAGEVTYLSRECAETCLPQDDTQDEETLEEGEETVHVSCCKGDGCNHGNSINTSTSLTVLTRAIATWLLWLL